MAHVSIIGTGNMGQAIAGIVAKGGHTVELLGHGDADKPVTGDIVVLAVPYPAVADVLAAARRAASPARSSSTSPTRWTSRPSTRSPSRPTARPPPRSPPRCRSPRVLKAFNTTFAATLAAGTVGAAAHHRADRRRRRRRQGAARRRSSPPAACSAIDAGSLRRARELEAIGFLQITLAAAEKISWTGGFAVVA